MVRDGQAFTVNSQIVTAFNLWFPKDDCQKVLCVLHPVLWTSGCLMRRA
jgi:hypothetical protein